MTAPQDDPIETQLRDRLKRIAQISEDADLTAYEKSLLDAAVRECAALRRLIKLIVDERMMTDEYMEHYKRYNEIVQQAQAAANGEEVRDA